MAEKFVLGVIPARYGSTRFPAKMLHPIAGKPLIQRVCERVSLATSLDRLVVATDDERIFDRVTQFGVDAIMTSPSHQTGTDRIAEVARAIDCTMIVNVQGDEPLIDPAMIDAAVARFSTIPDFRFGSAMTSIDNRSDLENPNIVKVVTGVNSQALYFSRHPIPFRRNPSEIPTWQHIGFYVYSREFLFEFSAMPPSPIETVESLEQLRALENGIRIDMLATPYKGVGVDTLEDVERIERELARLGID